MWFPLFPCFRNHVSNKYKIHFLAIIALLYTFRKTIIDRRNLTNLRHDDVNILKLVKVPIQQKMKVLL